MSENITKIDSQMGQVTPKKYLIKNRLGGLSKVLNSRINFVKKICWNSFCQGIINFSPKKLSSLQWQRWRPTQSFLSQSFRWEQKTLYCIHKTSFSSTFLVRIFCTNDVSSAFSSYVLALAKTCTKNTRV